MSSPVTLHELADTLPNGFHDAEIRTVSVDYCDQRAVLQLEVWVGSMNAPPEHGREVYRLAELELRGLAYLAMEPPDHNYPYGDGSPIGVDLSQRSVPVNGPPPRHGYFAACFFVTDWNSCITVSAQDAALQWAAPAYDRGQKQEC